jgi:hypothetical protein
VFLLVLGPCFRQQSGAQPSGAEREPPPSQTSARRGAITGVVLADNGQPMPHIEVILTEAGSSRLARRIVSGTDEMGRFQASNLIDVAYKLSVRAPGFYRASGPEDPQYYRTGQSALVTMTRGGVIAGTVKNATGEPLVNASVRALPLRQLDQKISAVMSSTSSVRQTDDRGMYRLYGLPPGVYIVNAQSGISFSGATGDERAPTYYPSAALGNAEEIKVQAGQEVNGIDITYREERGYVVSGTVTEAKGTEAPGSLTVMLTNASKGILQQTQNLNPQSHGHFAFHGVPTGDYFVVARMSASNDRDNAISPPRRFSVKGAEATGLNLVLGPTASVSGRVVIEQLPSPVRNGCTSPTTLASVVVSLRRDTSGESNQHPWHTVAADAAPDAQGLFALFNLTAGRYRISVNLPSSCWFIKGITPIGNPQVANKTRAPVTTDLATTGIMVKPGSRLDQVRITLAQGAATVSGRIVSEGGIEVPPDLFVYLVPAIELADAPFYQAPVIGSGEFLLTNLAPGKYFVVGLRDAKGGPSERAPQPRVLDAQTRTELRKLGPATGPGLELSPYQQITGLSVSYSPNSERK